MKKILIIQKTIPTYRIPIFNLLGDYYDLTIVYSEGKKPQNVKFQSLYIPTINIHWRFHKRDLYFFARKFDVVICTQETSFFITRLLGRLPRNFKLIFWGIGVAAGYNILFDSDERSAKGTLKQINQSDAMVFYSDYPVNKYTKMGVNSNKLFVANNTVEVLPIENNYEKDSFLFIGSLYAQKRIDILLNAYKKAKEQTPEIPKLIIIGDGAEKNNLKSYVQSNGLEQNVVFTGEITDENILRKYFSKALLCISPNQAGLSVLKSMGYGVPFVTHKDAITGGEIFNIHNGKDGIIMTDFGELEEVLSDCASNKQKYIEMGEAAQLHYINYRQPRFMVQGFVDAITYVLR